MISPTRQNTVLAAGIALAAAFSWGASVLVVHAIGMMDAIAGAAASVDALAKSGQQTVALVNRPCGGGHPCGTLANLDKVVVKSGDAIVQTQLLERQVPAHVLATLDAYGTVPAHLNGVADAATGTANQATATLGAAQTTIAGLQPLETSLTRTSDASTFAIKHLDTLLASKDLSEGIAHLNQTAGNVAGITGSVDKMTAHLEKQVDSPKPLWKALVPMGETAGKIWACLAEKVCVQ